MTKLVGIDIFRKLASVTYFRCDDNHYVYEKTGTIVSATEKGNFIGKLIAMDNDRPFPTTIFLYKFVECSSSPVVMGSLALRKNSDATLTRYGPVWCVFG